MYQSNNIIPNNRKVMYPNYSKNPQDERFLAPFLIGGIAGTALGYGIGNNNNYNRPPYGVGPVYYVPGPYIPPYTYNQNFYY